MELEKLKEKMKGDRPVQWDMLPDISLYMDQVVSYMSRQLIDFSEGERLTPAMVNNYIKEGLLPRAEGKRYYRDHIAYLTAICMLKQVLQVKDTKTLLEECIGNRDISDFYKEIGELLDSELTGISDKLPEDMNREELSKAALSMAVASYSQQLACKRLLDILRDKEAVEEK